MKRPFSQRLADWLVYTGAILLVAYFVLPSRLFLDVQNITYTGRDAVMVRHTPLGEVTARWHTEVVPEADDAADCSASGEAPYQVEKLDTVRFTADPRLWPCIDAGPPYAIRDSWQVLLFGMVPLRPYSITTIYTGDER
jgi:hypothetical protein